MDCGSCGKKNRVGNKFFTRGIHFRPLDHQFGEDVCAAITEQVKQEQLIESL